MTAIPAAKFCGTLQRKWPALSHKVLLSHTDLMSSLVPGPDKPDEDNHTLDARTYVGVPETGANVECLGVHSEFSVLLVTLHRCEVEL